MNVELLLAHFNRISDAPDAVPRLRRFIVDLAVRGKLVEQSPGDEPISMLLKPNLANIRNGRKKQLSQPVPILTSDHFPFCCPPTWEWLQLKEIGVTHTGSTPPSGNPEYFGNHKVHLSQYRQTSDFGNAISLTILRGNLENQEVQFAKDHSKILSCDGVHRRNPREGKSYRSRYLLQSTNKRHNTAFGWDGPFTLIALKSASFLILMAQGPETLKESAPNLFQGSLVKVVNEFSFRFLPWPNSIGSLPRSMI